MHKVVGMLLAGLIAVNVQAEEMLDDVGRFNANVITPPIPWRVIRFDDRIPPTQYRVITWDGVASVEAQANASMALLARPLTIDLQRTPVLCWRWRIDAPLKTADMATKAGDDYAARVYIAFRLPTGAMDFPTRTKLRIARSLYDEQMPDAALNYVWDNRYPVGTRRPNAYTDRTQMIVLRSGAAEAGRWVMERRDVLADAEQTFGSANISATLLALASDTDNTKETAHAGFADLHFVSRQSACTFPEL